MPISIAGVVVLLASARFGKTAVFLIGFPALFIASDIAAGARMPSRIPNRDALVYIGISIVVVIGAVLYAFYSR